MLGPAAAGCVCGGGRGLATAPGHRVLKEDMAGVPGSLGWSVVF